MQDETQTISKKLLILNAVLVLSIVYMIFIIYGSLNKERGNLALVYNEKKQEKIFENVTIEAKAAYVYDVVNDRAIYKKNEFTQLPLASITKLMTALTAVELLPNNSRVTIRKEFLVDEGDTGLIDGESWILRDLLDFSLAVSSNDGVRSVASVIGAMSIGSDDYDLGRKEFIKQMNSRAERLGLQQTYFINESGLDEVLVSGGYGSALDVSKLMQYILKNNSEIIELTKYESSDISSLDRVHTAKNTNISVNKIPGLIASKTGYTNLAGGNLVIVFDASIGRPIIVVVLGSSQEGRFTDVEKLVEASLTYLDK